MLSVHDSVTCVVARQQWREDQAEDADMDEDKNHYSHSW